MASNLMPRRVAAALAMALLVGACTEQAPTEPAAAPLLASHDGPTLIECPTNVTSSATAVIGAFGGSVTVGGSSITLPPAAVLEPTTITVTVPASKYVEIDVTANGAEHFDFLVPATITISYARCTRSDINQKTLTAWYIDSVLKTLLQPMGGFDNKVTRTVTFTTEHLSGYSIAE